MSWLRCQNWPLITPAGIRHRRCDLVQRCRAGVVCRKVGHQALVVVGQGERLEGQPPAAWVEASTGPTGGAPTGYYPPTLDQPFGAISHELYWWRIVRADESHAFSALGNHGQFVFASPAERLIIVRTGERSGVTYFEWFELYTTIAHTVGRPTAP